jgi:hypothetical protein
MHGGIVQHASSVRAPKSLVARGGLARTFGGLAGFLVIIFLGAGYYILQDAFANPRNAGAVAVLCAAFLITLAAILLFFLLKPPKTPRAMRRDRSASVAQQVVRPSLKPAPGSVRKEALRNNLPYQRMYVDHSYIRP